MRLFCHNFQHWPQIPFQVLVGPLIDEEAVVNYEKAIVRAVVSEKIYEDFKKRLIEVYKKAKIGNPLSDRL